MKTTKTLILFLQAAFCAATVLFTGCKKPDGRSGDASTKSKSEITAASLGLPSDFENAGAEPGGRIWFRQKDDADGKREQWVFDPKDKTLYSANKDAKSGEWVLKAKPEVTAESLGLPANTVEFGKDPNGFYWFEIPGEADRRVYKTATKTLHRAGKNAAGEWEIGAALPAKP